MHNNLERILQNFDSIQKAPLAKIKAIQLEQLQKAVSFHFENNPTYQKMCNERKVTPEDIKTLKDIELLPIIERDFLKTHSFKHELGGFLSVQQSELVTYLNSSGSTGKSKRIPIARSAQDSIFRVCAEGMWLGGVQGYNKENGGLLMPIFPHGPWPSSFFVQNGAELIDFSIKAEMSMPYDWHKMNIKELQPKYIITSPSFISALLKEIGDDIDFETLNLDRILIGGEYFNESFRNEIEEKTHTKVIDLYGCAETQVASVECDDLHGSGWMHYMAHNDIIEVVEPGTNNVLPLGEEGEMIISVLNRDAWPVIRYRMGDIIALHPEEDYECSCGSHLPRMSRIRGRADDMLVYGNANIYPEMIFNAVGKVSDVSSDKFKFQIISNQNDHGNYFAKLVVEQSNNVNLPKSKIKLLEQTILQNLLNESNELEHAVTKGKQIEAPIIEIVKVGKLYKQEGKLRRMEDLRYVK